MSSTITTETPKFTLSSSNSAEELRPGAVSASPTAPSSIPNGGSHTSSETSAIDNTIIPSPPAQLQKLRPTSVIPGENTDISPRSQAIPPPTTQSTTDSQIKGVTHHQPVASSRTSHSPSPRVGTASVGHQHHGAANVSDSDSHNDNDNDSENGINDGNSSNDENAINDNEADPEATNPINFLQFKKKNVKPRTQSFQSVLSTASLKSLTQPPIHRNSSIISSISNVHNNKNFQSYIQAPVLSSISNPRKDEIEIGRQLPFDHKSHQEDQQQESNDNDTYEDPLIQQQQLTLNALKKLSLSPLPRIDNDNFDETTDTRARKSEPYQPAAVDLSTFASLTRQPNVNQRRLSGASEMADSLKPLSTSTSVPNSAGSTGSQVSIQSPLQQLQTVQRSSTNGDISNQSYPNKTKNTLLNDLTQRRRSQNSPMTLVNRIPSPRSIGASQGLPQVNNTPSNPPIQQTTQHPNPPPANAVSYFPVPQVHSPAPSGPPIKQKHLQHIKGLRSPMYVPAVLRKTIDEESGEPSTAISATSSTNNDSSAASMRSVDSTLSVDSRSSSPVLSPSSTSTIKNFKSYEHFLRQPPSRKHWLKDETVYKCGITQCPREFNFFERRHHCRKCGAIFCKEHTSHFLYINHLAQFTTGGRGTLSRVCDGCIGEYNEFMKSQFGVNLYKNGDTTPRTSVGNESWAPERNAAQPKQFYERQSFTATDIPTSALNKDLKDGRSETIVGSVPANWSWSSF
ncbi:Zn finger protein [Yamadazyma tenuis]|uniref:Zn finger protein n=1 Tax=Candida tenuis TaxID=2315449 RepID=UPI00279F999A|nr:Zn finger protein [Yamadazyma tenuis]